MSDFEQLGLFYLGKEFDLEAGRATDELVLYDAKDMTTHCVCVGMTGSGKTGLCLSVLEEAAIDGIPVIAIDPKGDLSNLLLTFPELRPEDFQPWIDPSDAQRKSLSVEQLAAQTAQQWQTGLAAWGQDGARIARFRQACDLAIYTPGSSAGLPLTVLRSFAAPPAAVLSDAEALRDRVSAAASGLLSLLGVDSDPISGREHILLANLLDYSWRKGQDLDLAGLIRGIQSPPFDKVGFIDLETFFPAKERFGLAMQLNNLAASPGFSAWLEGEPLDIGSLLHTSAGKPRISILSIAHLSDNERMFFVTILLNEVLSWMRSQPGSSSLRALLYMDEVFGYFPPTANPPSKRPMLTLLKQARAFGLGVMLATQNPVDLDYKGLSNCGTWFLGRLQTERDKARVLEGLEGASATAGAAFDRQKMEAILARLGNRVFLMNNVHEDQPRVIQTRWALSYLRGPLTRDQISRLMADRKSALPSSAGPPTSASSNSGEPSTSRDSLSPEAAGSEEHPRPVLPPDVPEAFLPSRGHAPAGARRLYRPAVWGAARLHYTDSKSGVDHWSDLHLLAPADSDLPPDFWSSAQTLAEPPEVENQPEPETLFSRLPAALSRAKSYSAWKDDLKNSLYRTQTLSLFRCPALKQTSLPDESERDFRIRLSQLAREQRDSEIEKLRLKYAPKIAAANEQLRRSRQRVEKEQAQANQSTFQAAVSFGTSILNAVLGKKKLSSGNVGRAATAAKAAGRAAQQRSDVTQANETVEALQSKLEALEAQMQADVDQLAASAAPDALAIETVELRPKKTEIAVHAVKLLWTPHWRLPNGDLTSAS